MRQNTIPEMSNENSERRLESTMMREEVYDAARSSLWGERTMSGKP